MEGDEAEQPLAGPRFTAVAQAAFSGSEQALYIVVGLLLVLAAVLVALGTLDGVVTGIPRAAQRPVGL